MSAHRRSTTLGIAFAAAALAAGGCTAIEPRVAPSREPRTSAHLYVTRPFQVIPEPDPFVQGVITAYTEQLVLSGYAYTGLTLDPEDEGALVTHLAELNQRIPGTAAIHLTFVEAPIVVGFGKAYTQIVCTVYDPKGQIILRAELDPPEPRSLRDLLLPPKRPDVMGRSWGRQTWQYVLSLLFPERRI